MDKAKGFVKKNKRYLIEVLVLLIVMLCAAKIIKITMIYPASQIYKTEVITAEETKIKNPSTRKLNIYSNLLLLEEGSDIKQSFVATNDKMTGIQLVFLTDGDLSSGMEDIKGEMDVTMTDDATGEEVLNTHYNLCDITWIDNSVIFTNNVINDAKGKKYTITVSVKGVDERRPVYLDMTGENVYANGSLTIDGKTSSNSLILGQACYKFDYIMTASKLFMAFFAVMVFLIYYMIRIKKSKLENIYLVLAIFIGVMYMIFLPPYTAPDDQTHLNNCYNYANKILNVSETENVSTIYMRADDANSGLSYQPSIDEYELVYRNFFKKASDTTLVEVNYNSSLNAAWYAYIPGTLGIVLGRLLSMGGVFTLYLGTILQYALFVTVIYLCIKKVKAGKLIFLVTALLPMVMQQTTSYSYDVTLMSVAFSFTALCINLSYEDTRFTVKHGILMFLLTLLFIKIKMGAYIPLCLLVLFMNKNAFEKSKDIKLDGRKKRFIFMFIYFAFCAGVFLSDRMGYFTKISGGSAAAATGESAAAGYANYIWWAGSEGYTIKYVLSNIYCIPQIIMNTIQSYGSEYIEGMIGNPVGWSNYGWYYPNMIIYGFAVLLILSAVSRLESTEKGYMVLEKTFSVKERIVSALAVLGCMAFIVAGMWFSWTPISFKYIVGVQGRYFLPMLPLILMFIKNKTIVTKKKLSGIIIAVMIILHAWAFWSIGCFTGMVLK